MCITYSYVCAYNTGARLIGKYRKVSEYCVQYNYFSKQVFLKENKVSQLLNFKRFQNEEIKKRNKAADYFIQSLKKTLHSFGYRYIVILHNTHRN